MAKERVFISCGQLSEEEKSLGTDIQDLVRKLTPFEPYFAEYQTTLEGLTKNIFGALYNNVGFIVVMHHRGHVDSKKDCVRASVWIEQEIAIAAFINQILGKRIETIAFLQKGIALEGVRKQLLLNPKEFTHHQEVLDHLKLVLLSWNNLKVEFDKHELDIDINYQNLNIRSERHDYRLLVTVTNRGIKPINNYHVDLEFPTILIERPSNYVLLVRERSTPTHSLFRVTEKNHSGKPIYPEDSLVIMSLDYFIDHNIFLHKHDVLRGKSAIMTQKEERSCVESLSGLKW